MDAAGPLPADDVPRANAAEKTFSIASTELRLLLEATGALVAGELAEDPANAGVEQIASGVERLVERAARQSFQIAVLALAKSGKSTLINALLGREVLPSSNVPETARIVRVRHSATARESSLHEAGRALARGWPEVHDHLRRLNAEVRSSAGGGTPKPELTLEAPLLTLLDRPLGAYPFEVLDTPGPNEAGAEILRASVDRLLGEVDVILYVLDYTKLRTEEERGMFSRLTTLRPELLERLSERLFFAVNKIDLENSRGLSPEQTRDCVAALLREQLPGLRIEPGRVLLVSSEPALLARQVQSGQAGPGTLRDFARLCFGLRGQGQATLRRLQPHAGAILEGSGLLELEQQVINFLYERRGRLLVQALLDDLDRYLTAFDNQLQTTWRALQIEQGKLEAHLARLEADRREAELAFEQIDGLATRAADRLEAWVRDRFEAFHQEVETLLERTCGEGQAGEAAPGAGTGAATASGWERLRGLFREGGEAPDDAERSAAEERAAQAYRTIAANLQSAFAAFWGELEHAAWERQREVFGELEELIGALCARIDESVSRQLALALRPVRLAFPAPSFEALQEDLGRRIESFIERRQREQKTTETRRILTRPAGWCVQAQYQDQTVEVSSTITVFSFSRARVLEYWRDRLRSRTEASVATARAIVRDQVGAAADQARLQLHEHRAGYLAAVRHALGESRQGEEERGRRLTAVERARARLGELQERVRRCQEFLGSERRL
jgi:GTPase SAR1 family protein